MLSKLSELLSIIYPIRTAREEEIVHKLIDKHFAQDVNSISRTTHRGGGLTLVKVGIKQSALS